MARIRTVKPEYWTSEQVVRCSRDARLLFIGMWNQADDGGVLPAKHLQLKLQVLPNDEDCTADDVRRWVHELISQGLLLEFEVKGASYWWITGWKHQKIDRPTYRHPRPPVSGAAAGNSTSPRRDLAEDSTSARRRNLPGAGAEPGKEEYLNPSLPSPEEDPPPRGSNQAEEPRKPRQSRVLNAGFDGKDIGNTAKVLNYLKTVGPKLKLDPDDFLTQQRVIACAERARECGTKPGGLFVSLVKELAGGNYAKLTDQQMDRAKRRLLAHQRQAAPQVSVARDEIDPENDTAKDRDDQRQRLADWNLKRPSTQITHRADSGPTKIDAELFCLAQIP